jgi:Zn-dependent protease
MGIHEGIYEVDMNIGPMAGETSPRCIGPLSDPCDHVVDHGSIVVYVEERPSRTRQVKAQIGVSASIPRAGRQKPMVKCDHCGKEVYLPFRCSYCGGYFCSEHRLPEFHNCTGLYKRSRAFDTERTTTRRSHEAYFHPTRRRFFFRNLFRFSERELRDLGVGLLLIVALPFSVRKFLSFPPAIIAGAVGIFAAAFLLHELAHKFTAQRFGYWAEFRLNTMGVMITVLSFFSPFKLVAPGAVLIAGLMYGDDYGKISLAGPVTNIAQAAVYLVIGLLSRTPVVRYLMYLGVIINSSLALFNLLPFGLFDGVKVFRWDWRIWLSAIAIAGMLYLYPYSWL